MEIPELYLGPTRLGFNKNSSSSSSPVESAESKGTRRKRKFFQDHHLKSSAPSPSLQTSSGKMYDLNRRTSRKSWNWPINQASVNLELNISTLSGSSSGSRFNRSSETIEEAKNNCKYDGSRDNSNNNNTVALACRKCHLLLVLSRSSPCCPNCKYLHSL
ncbi:hypothetical protein ACFX11_032033 [Malus domestica]